MTKVELQKRLRTEGIPPDSYSLDGGALGEELCLAQTGSGWEVYYSERGVKTGLKQFRAEQDACEYFYRSLIDMLS